MKILCAMVEATGGRADWKHGRVPAAVSAELLSTGAHAGAFNPQPVSKKEASCLT